MSERSVWDTDLCPKVLNRGAEESHFGFFAAQAEADPVGMLRGKEEAFGVRHQAEHSAAGIAQTGERPSRSTTQN